MKRFALGALLALGLLLLLLFGLNLFDAAPDAAVGEPPPPADFTPGNGFFILWGFAEAPGVDPGAAAFQEQLRAMLPPPGPVRTRSPYGQWLARLEKGFRQHWRGANFLFPPLHGEGVVPNLSQRRGQVLLMRDRLEPLLGRLQMLLAARRIDDFTPAGRECPSRSLFLATQTARLFTALQVLAAVDGRWQEAGERIAAMADCGFRLIAGGRTWAVNALGKMLVELALKATAALLNLRDCPPAFGERLLASMPERAIGRFGTAPVRRHNWLSFRMALARAKSERIVDPMLLRGFFHQPAGFFALERLVAMSGERVYLTAHALAAFFLQEGETAAAMRDFWEEIGRLEATPPWQWRLQSVWRRRLPPLWWLRNPLGKMMVRAAVPYEWPIVRSYALRSYEVKARYDLVRLLLQARQLAGAGALSAEQAQRLLAAAGADPFSGQPYRLAAGRDVLYSLGADRIDQRGRERPELWRDSDIAVPIHFVNRDS